jgi:hypothetical protein
MKKVSAKPIPENSANIHVLHSEERAEGEAGEARAAGQFSPKEEFPQQFRELLGQLRAAYPELTRQRPVRTDGNGHEQPLEFVEWHKVADLLDRIAPT